MNLRYYDEIDDSDLFLNYKGEYGYIIFQPWPCGLNNVRQGLELAVCLAYLTNRTLVIPEYFTFWLIGKKRILDFYSITGIKYELLDDFIAKNNFRKWRIDDEFFSLYRDQIPKEIYVSKIVDNLVDEIHSSVIYEGDIQPDPGFIKGRKLVNLYSLVPLDKRIVYFHQNLFGVYYQILHTSDNSRIKRLISKHVRPSDVCFNQAENLINRIQDRSYYSIHLRRYDFQYKETLLSPSQIIQNIEQEIPRGSRLYIATDFKYNVQNPLEERSKFQEKTNPDFFDEFKEKYQVIFMSDLIEKESDITPVIEQLICTRGLKFYNQHPSTFSSYIFRMRGIMGDVDSTYYDVSLTNPEMYQSNFSDYTGPWSSWSREFMDAWNF